MADSHVAAPTDPVNMSSPPSDELQQWRPDAAHSTKPTIHRQATFSRRCNGLLKRAQELSVLCDAEVAVIVFSPTGELSNFASSSMDETVKRYQNLQLDELLNLEETKSCDNGGIPPEMHACLTNPQRSEKIKSLSFSELKQIESYLESVLGKIHARRNGLLEMHMEELKSKV